MKYRYYINDTEVFPKGEWSIEYQRNEGQIFFRRIFEGELTFGGADYDLITSLDCEIAEFDIYCGGTVFWQGQFQYPYLLGFDDDSCTVVLTPEVVDEYSCIMDSYEKSRSMYPAGTLIRVHNCGGLLQWNVVAARGGARLVASTVSGNVNWLNYLINVTVGLQCNLTISSSFMCRSDFPNGDNYAANYGTNNYITGATNRLEYVYIIPNNGMRIAMFGVGTGCDGYVEWNFKDIETLLRNAFNAYWFIDENGHFRIEHIHYFDPAFAHSDYIVGKDLDTVMDRGGRSFAYRRNKYEYETGRMYDQERWSWQHWEGTEAGYTHGIDFEGVPIFYGATVDIKSDYVPGAFKEKKIATPDVWTDIPWAIALFAGTGVAGDINCPGWTMVDVDSGTGRIRCENGIYSGGNIENGHLSTANLQHNYHTYDRIFINGHMNTGGGTPTTVFDTAQKHKLQEAIEFPLCCDESFDPLNRIRTGLGDGEVKAAVQKKQSLEVELWHEFDC